MSRSRRPSVSIYDYPEHLNPFNDDIANSQTSITTREAKTKDGKHKFWTFGRSRKRSSNSFSIKSTWNGIFGKRKDASDMREKRSTITTVSSTYKQEPYFEKPVAAPRISRDQQEFDQALGTLARRRKYTMDDASRCSSSLTVNGDPARIYDGAPRNTTTSIMGDLTPKAPARRFGQVSPRPTDKIPPLDYEDKDHGENGQVTLRARQEERTPIAPIRRFGGNRSSRRSNGEEANGSRDASFRDENENLPDDYVFKRFARDSAVRRSNLSINSCVSVASTASAYGRKKRRAPQPPKRMEQLETTRENETPKLGSRVVESIDIARVTENIDEMTKKSRESGNDGATTEQEKSTETSQKISEGILDDVLEMVVQTAESSTLKDNISNNDASSPNIMETKSQESNSGESISESKGKDECVSDNETLDDIEVEYRRSSREKFEITKDIDRTNTPEESERVCPRRKTSSGTLPRSDSFSVKDEIEKIEKQIKALESKNGNVDSTSEEPVDRTTPTTSARSSLEANRRHFFQNMVDSSGNGVKIEFKELPREQKDIRVVRLTNLPAVLVDAPREPVKVIELHISEPIKQKPELVEDVNPIPKPRRHSALSLNDTESTVLSSERKSPRATERGNSF